MTKSQETIGKLVNYIRAGYPAAWMHTAEEARAERILREVAKQISEIPDENGKCWPMKVFVWSFTEGYQGDTNGAVTKGVAQGKPDMALALMDPATKANRIPDNSLVVLRDYHTMLDAAPTLTRNLRDLMAIFKSTGTFLVILSPINGIKPEFEKDMLLLELPLPDSAEFSAVLDGMIQANKKLSVLGDKVFEIPREAVVDGLAGLTLIEGENVLALTVIKHGKFNSEALKTIHREKAAVLKSSGLLRYVESDRTMSDVGGLENVKQWSEERMVAYTPEAREAGLPKPKGVLMVGVQGCGKSLVAKAIAALHQVPLIEGDLGDVMASHIGESESRMTRLLATVDAIGRCVLRLDEFEKMAGGGRSSDEVDAGTTSRTLKKFLTWLNDRESEALVVATINRIDRLDAEIIRKGRFDEIFFVDLPNRRERREIFGIHLKRQKQDTAKFELGGLVDATEGYSGAEIEQAIIAARFKSFSKKSPMNTEAVLAAVKASKPLSVTMAAQIEAVRERLKDVAVPASLPDTPEASEPVGRKVRA